MKTIEEVIRAISAPDELSRAEAKKRWNAIAKPLGGLGQFEEMIEQIAALRGSTDFDLKPRALLVFCADNGVVAQGVSQCGSEVTAKVAVALADGHSTANTLAKNADCRVLPADLGILNFSGHPGLRNLRVRNGTGDISIEPAMTVEECRLAMAYGAALAEEQAKQGTVLLAVGEMGIGNTTTSTALASALLNLDPDEITGRGAGLSSEGLERKKKAIHRALARRKAANNDIIGMIADLGGLDIAAICGALLGAAANRVPVIIDGIITAVAALCTLWLCPDAAAAMLVSHRGSEPLASQLLTELGQTAPLDAGMHLGEGTGALMLMPLLDMVYEVYRSGQIFGQLGIEAYQPLK